jgi:hypothetical protein
VTIIVVIHRTFIITGNDWASFERVNIQITRIAFGHGDPGESSTGDVLAGYLLPAPLTAVADAPGSWSYSDQLDEPGMYKITAVGQSGEAVSTTVQVLAAQPSSVDANAGALARPATTPGPHYLVMALIGSVLAATGAVVAVLTRSRRRHSRAA